MRCVLSYLCVYIATNICWSSPSISPKSVAFFGFFFGWLVGTLGFDSMDSQATAGFGFAHCVHIRVGVCQADSYIIPDSTWVWDGKNATYLVLLALMTSEDFFFFFFFFGHFPLYGHKALTYQVKIDKKATVFVYFYHHMLSISCIMSGLWWLQQWFYFFSLRLMKKVPPDLRRWVTLSPSPLSLLLYLALRCVGIDLDLSFIWDMEDPLRILIRTRIRMFSFCSFW